MRPGRPRARSTAPRIVAALAAASACALAPPIPALGVDYGTVRTGVCVGSGFAARPLEVFESGARRRRNVTAP